MSWDLKSDRPIYSQLVEQIELMIISGFFPPGSRLPSVREMAQNASVNPNTMQRALVKLEEDGLIVTHRTNGRTITEDEDMIKKSKTQLAKAHVLQFFDSMNKMGFEKTDVLSIINEMLGEWGK